MNGWFPTLNEDGVIASGNAGIWVTREDGSVAQVSPVGLSPIWSDGALIFNRNDGSTDSQGTIIPAAYNKYRGSDDGRWAGATDSGNGHVDVYSGIFLMIGIPQATAPRFGGTHFGYLTPFQPRPGNVRDLVVNNAIVATDVILDWTMERSGRFYVYQIATGTYTRQIKNGAGAVVSIHDEEVPLVAFVGPDGAPWLLSNTPNDGAFVRPLYDYMGYRITGELYYPDALMRGGKLRVVGSAGDGTPRFDIWIDFSAPRVDLRKVAVVVPPDPGVPPPVVNPPPVDHPPVQKPPKPTIPPPQRPYRAHKEHHMAVDTLGVLRGPGGLLARPDEKNTGPWGTLNHGFRGLVFDGRDKTDERYHFLRPGDAPNTLVHKANDAVIGCDATKHSGGLNQQFYQNPDGDRNHGWAEEWQFYENNANGAIMAVVEYAPGRGGDDGPFFSYPLAFEVL